MANLEIRPTEQGDIDAVIADIRAADHAELLALGYTDIIKPLKNSVRRTITPLTCLINDKPACLFGIGRQGWLSDKGVPWLISTNQVEVAPLTFLRACQQVFPALCARYSQLENWVDARNDKAIAWLKWLGFVFDAPAPYGTGEHLFHRFHMDLRGPAGV